MHTLLARIAPLVALTFAGPAVASGEDCFGLTAGFCREYPALARVWDGVVEGERLIQTNDRPTALSRLASLSQAAEVLDAPIDRSPAVAPPVFLAIANLQSRAGDIDAADRTRRAGLSVVLRLAGSYGGERALDIMLPVTEIASELLDSDPYGAVRAVWSALILLDVPVDRAGSTPATDTAFQEVQAIAQAAFWFARSGRRDTAKLIFERALARVEEVALDRDGKPARFNALHSVALFATVVEVADVSVAARRRLADLTAAHYPDNEDVRARAARLNP